MKFNEVIETLEQNKNTHSIISKPKFKKLFEILPAQDDGNCLFSSIEQLVPTFNLHELRQLVCEYYKTFDKFGTYPPDSIKAKLQMQMISDNEDDDEDGEPVLHENLICNNFEWAGLMDVIALSDILSVNIIVMIMRKEGYFAQPFLHSERSKTICIKFNGSDHFEPLLPKFEMSSPTSSSASAPASSSSKHFLDKALDISPETLKLITQMESKSKSKKIKSNDTIRKSTRSRSKAKGVSKKRKIKHKKQKQSR